MAACSNIRTMTKDVFAPGEREVIQIGQHTQNFAIQLSDELIKSIKMSTVSTCRFSRSSRTSLTSKQFEDNEVGHVVGLVANHESSSIPVLEPLLEVVASTSGAVQALPQSTLIGDLKLTSLKSRLARLGIEADFAGEGVLVCSSAEHIDMDVEEDQRNQRNVADFVTVKKEGRDQVVVEGMPSDIYYTVRKEIYGLHAIVAA